MDCYHCGRWFLELTIAVDYKVHDRKYIRHYMCQACYNAHEAEGDEITDPPEETLVIRQKGDLMLIVKND